MNVVVCMWPTTAGGRVNMHVGGAHGEGRLEQMETKQLYASKILE